MAVVMRELFCKGSRSFIRNRFIKKRPPRCIKGGQFQEAPKAELRLALLGGFFLHGALGLVEGLVQGGEDVRALAVDHDVLAGGLEV